MSIIGYAVLSTDITAGDSLSVFPMLYFGNNFGNVSRRELLMKNNGEFTSVKNIPGNAKIPSLYTAMVEDPVLCDIVYEYGTLYGNIDEIPCPLIFEVVCRWIGKFQGTRSEFNELSKESYLELKTTVLENASESLYTFSEDECVRIQDAFLFLDIDKSFDHLCILFHAEIGTTLFRNYFAEIDALANVNANDGEIESYLEKIREKFYRKPPFCGQESLAVVFYLMDYKSPRVRIKRDIINIARNELLRTSKFDDFYKFLNLFDTQDNVQFSRKNNNYSISSDNSCVLMGSEKNDFLHGSPHDDFIHGKGGDDLIVGGKSNDVLCGSIGNDIYIYRKGDGYDTIREIQSYDGDINTLFLVDIDPDDVAFSLFDDVFSISIIDGGRIDVLAWVNIEEIPKTLQIQRIVFGNDVVYTHSKIQRITKKLLREENMQ